MSDSSVYVNEFDPFAAAWLRELMAAGHLPAGIVDERSITDVEATDVRGFRECHWFAGIGGWPLALRLAGWPAERPVWTGSCPCQPYSSAGKRKGNADERDLWPVFARLIRECRPATVFGEQVASAIRFGWIDRVRADLEAEGYAVGFAVLGAHSVGAPHQRQRLYWCATRPVADSDAGTRSTEHEQQHGERPNVVGRSGGIGAALGVGDADEGRRAEGDAVPRRAAASAGAPVPTARGVAYADGGLAGHGGVQPGGEHGQQPEDGGAARGVGDADDEHEGATEQHGARIGNARGASGAVCDHWRDAIGIECRDGKRRRVSAAQSGVHLLADGLSAGVGRGGVPCADRYPLAGKSPNRAARLRGYGNAICVQTAAAFVKAFLESEGGE